MERFGFSGDARQPVVLTIPGLNNSGPGHWQTLWEEQRGDCQRVDLGSWASPNRNAWVTRLDSAIREAHAPVILAAHSLGCLAVAWWGALQSQAYGWPVTGALLVAPPDCDRMETPETIGGFGPTPRAPLPFPSIMVASRDDPYIFFERAHSVGKNWGCEFVDAGHAGHLNADSGLGDWAFGQSLLERLIDNAQEQASAIRQMRAPTPLGQQQGARPRRCTPKKSSPPGGATRQTCAPLIFAFLSIFAVEIMR